MISLVVLWIVAAGAATLGLLVGCLLAAAARADRDDRCQRCGARR